MKRFLNAFSAALCLILSVFVLIGCTSLFTLNEGETPPSAGTTATSDDALTVSFDTNGGTAIEPQRVSPGQPAVAPEDPVRFGFLFDGWQTSDGTPWTFDQRPITKSVTLVAKWRETRFSLSLRTVSDPFEDLFKPFEEQILSVLNYDFITTQFSSFVDTTDPKAEAVYKRMDELQINEDPEAFMDQVKGILGVYSVSPSFKYKSVNSVFYHNYKEKYDEVAAGLRSDDPETKAAALALQQTILEQIRFLLPAATDSLPTPTVLGTALYNDCRGFGYVHALFKPTLQSNVPLLIDVSEETADVVLRKDGSFVNFEYDERLLPATPKSEETTTGDEALFPGETPVTDEKSAAVPANWFAFADPGASDPSSGYVSLTSFSGYVIRKTVTLSVPGTKDAAYLTAVVSVTGTDEATASATRVMVSTEIGGDLMLYRANGEDDSSRWFDPYGSLRIPAGETLTVNLYVYIDGTDPDSPIDNLSSLDHIRVSVWFGAAESK